jgi:CheY-like chemotaxis protein
MMTPTNASHAPPPLHGTALPPSEDFGGHGFEAPSAGGDAGVGGNKPSALVVDDAPDVTEMLAILMRCAGYDVTMAFSAHEAMERARRRHFDVVISDIGMPGMNGYELATALRTLPDYASVPLIAVTGFVNYSDRVRALDSGFNDFLTKPINTTELLDTVERLRH